ncbi:ig-like domain-containing protein [Trichonephila inaurata madagascariensis]|uniref:Ig-like domain-containing protein n=1 Tax=Trichonephila inaurata madagascariensis TaxID=2747483 RepID=A0A8X6Y058_9ARAC|nr:ig-like domain-containing protein [Trichonephila inaurata madagascariensis]
MGSGTSIGGHVKLHLLCLKLREIVVPAVVIRGEPVWLNCTYDLGNETLYSIKWHKNNVEFYRYLPEDRPPGQKYELAGIHLDLSRTDRGNIYMPYTDVESEGIYRCEVSTEAPNFQTVKAEREMRIYAISATITSSPPYPIAPSQPYSIASPQPSTVASSKPYTIASVQHLSTITSVQSSSVSCLIEVTDFQANDDQSLSQYIRLLKEIWEHWKPVKYLSILCGLLADAYCV